MSLTIHSTQIYLTRISLDSKHFAHTSLELAQLSHKTWYASLIAFSWQHVLYIIFSLSVIFNQLFHIYYHLFTVVKGLYFLYFLRHKITSVQRWQRPYTGNAAISRDFFEFLLAFQLVVF